MRDGGCDVLPVRWHRKQVARRLDRVRAVHVPGMPWDGWGASLAARSVAGIPDAERAGVAGEARATGAISVRKGLE